MSAQSGYALKQRRQPSAILLVGQFAQPFVYFNAG
jgi:hypothetical protein